MTFDEDKRPQSRALRSAIHLAHKLRLATLARESDQAGKKTSHGVKVGKHC